MPSFPKPLTNESTQIGKAASLKPWFGPHYARDVYLTLLHQETSKVPDTILKAALLRRATEDIRRIIALRQAKGSLQQLLQRGSIGDDLWTRFTVAEAEIEEVCNPRELPPETVSLIHEYDF